MGWWKVGLFAGGMLTSAVIAGASKSKTVRDAAVKATAAVLDCNDKIQAYTQNVIDDADDLRAEAERQRKIDAAVEERLAELEGGIREEVEAEVDGKPAKKRSRSAK